jgi:hypothetical protein
MQIDRQTMVDDEMMTSEGTASIKSVAADSSGAECTCADCDDATP